MYFFSLQNRNLFENLHSLICAKYPFLRTCQANLGKCRFLVAGFYCIQRSHFNRTTYQNNFFFYLHIYLFIFFIYSSFSSTFFTDISPGSVGVLVNGESHVSVSQVSEVTTFNKFLSEFDLMVPFASRFRFFRTNCLLLLL